MDAKQGKAAQRAVIELFVHLFSHCDYVLEVAERIAVLVENSLLTLADHNRMQPHVRVLGA